MRVVRRPQFDRELGRVPAPVREWALDWIDAADAPDATLSGVLKGSEGLKGGTFRNYYVRKWRRKGQGEHRLVFMAEGETVTFSTSVRARTTTKPPPVARGRCGGRRGINRTAPVGDCIPDRNGPPFPENQSFPRMNFSTPEKSLRPQPSRRWRR